MSESAYGGESAWGWDRGLNYYSQPQTPPEPQRKIATKQQEEAPKQSTRVIRGQQQESITTPTPENKTRVIRGPEELEQTEQEESIYDIGELRKKVMEELLKEKPVIVREITDELREKLKADLRKSFIQGEGGGR